MVSEEHKNSGPRSIKAVFALLSLIVIALCFMTHKRNETYRDLVSFWEDVVRKSPGKARGHYALGTAYQRQRWFNAAIAQYETAIGIDPDFADAHISLGFAYYYHRGWIDEAIEHYQVALRIRPDNANAHLNLGIAYKAKGWIDESQEEFNSARRLKDGNAK